MAMIQAKNGTGILYYWANGREGQIVFRKGQIGAISKYAAPLQRTLRSELSNGAADGVPMRLNAISEEQPENKNDEKKPTYAAADPRSAIVVSSSATQQKQYDQNDQDQTHSSDRITAISL
jgi:hypothetical protein